MIKLIAFFAFPNAELFSGQNALCADFLLMRHPPASFMRTHLPYARRALHKYALCAVYLSFMRQPSLFWVAALIVWKALHEL